MIIILINMILVLLLLSVFWIGVVNLRNAMQEMQRIASPVCFFSQILFIPSSPKTPEGPKNVNNLELYTIDQLNHSLKQITFAGTYSFKSDHRYTCIGFWYTCLTQDKSQKTWWVNLMGISYFFTY